ncbi:GntR family transcriptional regulator [Rhodococcus sp. NPDC055024]
MMTTKADQAYALLRRAIVVGDIGSDQPLDDSQLAERYGYGRTPMREALKRLAQEQFIVWHPRTPPSAREMTLKDIYRLQESRLVLEDAGVRLSAQRITSRQLDAVHSLTGQLQTALRNGNIYEAVELDFAIHNAVAAGSDNQYLVDAIDRMNSSSLRLWYRNYCGIGHLADETDKHTDIVEALDCRDPEAAAKAIQIHITESIETSIRLERL